MPAVVVEVGFEDEDVGARCLAPPSTPSRTP